MGIIGWILMGLLAGWLAKMFLPGRQPGGLLVTMIIGIVGSAIGGWIGQQLGWGGPSGFDLGSIALSVVGAMVFLMILGAIRGR
ncbi:MAG: GlsB/YeaQ/YmgE family stress response membrane protein [Planctomycetaceae bacterium]|nr:GlsB/YeaQ/YmgE family stress response membrane protein [Planctomycetaceae bacterium]